MHFKLPKSGLVGYVATSDYQPPCYQKAKTDFLAPDVRIEQTREDLVAGKDTVLEYIEKIKRGEVKNNSPAKGAKKTEIDNLGKQSPANDTNHTDK